MINNDGSFTVVEPRLWNKLYLSTHVILNLSFRSSARYWWRTCFVEDSDA